MRKLIEVKQLLSLGPGQPWASAAFKVNFELVPFIFGVPKKK